MCRPAVVRRTPWAVVSYRALCEVLVRVVTCEGRKPADPEGRAYNPCALMHKRTITVVAKPPLPCAPEPLCCPRPPGLPPALETADPNRRFPEHWGADMPSGFQKVRRGFGADPRKRPSAQDQVEDHPGNGAVRGEGVEGPGSQVVDQAGNGRVRAHEGE
jgi:hypothetical protein